MAENEQKTKVAREPVTQEDVKNLIKTLWAINDSLKDVEITMLDLVEQLKRAVNQATFDLSSPTQ